MLKLNNICKTFNLGDINEESIFHGVSLEVKDDDFICIVGSNGAGKSTLLNIVSGKLGIDRGSIILNGEDITDQVESQRCKKISRIFQDPSLGTVPSMTVHENLSMALNKGKKFNFSLLIDKKNESLFKESLKILDLGLEDKLEVDVSKLSGGQRQSLALIMSALTDPRLLLLDEHTAALDPKTSEIVMAITDRIVKEKKLATLMVTHNIDHAIRYGNRLIMMHRGQIILDVSGEEKKNLTKEKLLSLFKDVSDRSLFS
ncbi:putative ABC transport system ATP-binding protein [Proteiniborus ethanoligenes]|uniref:Putative ABC transport system ATP-binding protein n=1 Tax=Proteiniborus ethanoligenes TaxID=415015 RepID=A0A1H3MAP1_9FIRM|nr:ATP-binding cassette domain-containing protein [Proteiniborus ethanoligenes]SDY73751.1 putative ABC transport system ATP-binding protein [Proteiniborus ethanoligenes]